MMLKNVAVVVALAAGLAVTPAAVAVADAAPSCTGVAGQKIDPIFCQKYQAPKNSTGSGQSPSIPWSKIPWRSVIFCANGARTTMSEVPPNPAWKVAGAAYGCLKGNT